MTTVSLPGFVGVPYNSTRLRHAMCCDAGQRLQTGRIEMPATLDENIAAYESMKRQLEDEHFLHWVVFNDGELAGIYDDGLEARLDAWTRFRLSPYIVRLVGENNVEKKRRHLAAAIERRRHHGKD